MFPVDKHSLAVWMSLVLCRERAMCESCAVKYALGDGWAERSNIRLKGQGIKKF